ncbi:hypothetical protein LTR27_001613 [Elasticomyces elasticus]|nr:hypothetical protein LTR27_001613 [Elasticomyces elasticus]
MRMTLALPQQPRPRTCLKLTLPFKYLAPHQTFSSLHHPPPPPPARAPSLRPNSNRAILSTSLEQQDTTKTSVPTSTMADTIINLEGELQRIRAARDEIEDQIQQIANQYPFLFIGYELPVDEKNAEATEAVNEVGTTNADGTTTQVEHDESVWNVRVKAEVTTELLSVCENAEERIRQDNELAHAMVDYNTEKQLRHASAKAMIYAGYQEALQTIFQPICDEFEADLKKDYGKEVDHHDEDPRSVFLTECEEGLDVMPTGRTEEIKENREKALAKAAASKEHTKAMFAAQDKDDEVLFHVYKGPKPNPDLDQSPERENVRGRPYDSEDDTSLPPPRTSSARQETTSRKDTVKKGKLGDLSSSGKPKAHTSSARNAPGSGRSGRPSALDGVEDIEPISKYKFEGSGPSRFGGGFGKGAISDEEEGDQEVPRRKAQWQFGDQVLTVNEDDE